MQVEMETPVGTVRPEPVQQSLQVAPMQVEMGIRLPVEPSLQAALKTTILMEALPPVSSRSLLVFLFTATKSKQLSVEPIFRIMIIDAIPTTAQSAAAVILLKCCAVIMTTYLCRSL